MNARIGTVEWQNELDAFEAPFLQEKLLEKAVFATPEEYCHAFAEFKRYVALCAASDAPLAMSSRAVDEVWHQFILFTHEYFSFCGRFLGGYFHHAPRTSANPLAADGMTNFVAAYRNAFGAVPSIWGKASVMGENGSVLCSSEKSGAACSNKKAVNASNPTCCGTCGNKEKTAKGIPAGAECQANMCEG